MSDRIEIVFRGWLHALTFVLPGPPVFWLILFAPAQVNTWSWSGLLDVYQYGAPLVLLSVFVHLLCFLILGLPLFFAFWKKESIIWFLPVSLAVGLSFPVVFGIYEYGSNGDLDLFENAVCLGYGAVTAWGCWLANRRSKRAESAHHHQRPTGPAGRRTRP